MVNIMRKFLTVSIPIATIALFICIMLSGSFLKKSFGKEGDFSEKLNGLMRNVSNNAWDEAGEELEDLTEIWKKIKSRVQFSSERNEINYINTNLARLRGAIQAEDKTNALMEVYETYNHWKTLGE